MIVEIITISVSVLILFSVYFARLKSAPGRTFLFSENFLNSADELLFDLVKFIFKMYSLLIQNISGLIAHVPHKTISTINKVSHSVAKHSNNWVEKVTHKNTK